MKISGKRFVQVRTGKNCMAHLQNQVMLGPDVLFSVTFSTKIYILFLGGSTA